ncbi:MAG: hypothetical protein MJ186_03195 [Clostridia bacterium]|nr:hypothetical protein [Clostridia bacterium]
MANYVYNYVFCSAEGEKELLEYYTGDSDFGLVMYDYVSEIQADGIVEIRFDTRGSEYRSEFIIPFIKKHKETTWYCVEECEIEEGWFRWECDEVKLSVRRLTCSEEKIILCYKKMDQYLRPNSIMMLENTGLMQYEDIAANTEFKWQLSEKSVNRIIAVIMKYHNEMELGKVCFLPDEGNRIVEDLQYWIGPFCGMIETLLLSDAEQIQKDIKNGDINFRPDILDEILFVVNSALLDDKIDFQITSAYLKNRIDSEQDPVMNAIYREIERVNSRPAHAHFPTNTDKQAGWVFRESVLLGLAVKKIRWDNDVISNKDSLLPVVNLILDNDKDLLRVDYCNDLGCNNVLASEYYPIDSDSAEEVSKLILKVMDDPKWRKEKAVIFSSDDGYEVKVKDNFFNRKLFRLSKWFRKKS